MNNYLPLLQTTTLFAGLSAAELSTLLSRLGGSVRSYGKGEALVLAGEMCIRDRLWRFGWF